MLCFPPGPLPWAQWAALPRVCPARGGRREGGWRWGLPREARSIPGGVHERGCGQGSGQAKGWRRLARPSAEVIGRPRRPWGGGQGTQQLLGRGRRNFRAPSRATRASGQPLSWPGLSAGYRAGPSHLPHCPWRLGREAGRRERSVGASALQGSAGRRQAGAISETVRVGVFLSPQLGRL